MFLQTVFTAANEPESKDVVVEGLSSGKTLSKRRRRETLFVFVMREEISRNALFEREEVTIP